MNVLEIIAEKLGEPNVQALSQKLGADRTKSLTAVSHAVPALLLGLANKANTPAGASAIATTLDKEHDGSVFMQIPALVSNPDSRKGNAIVNEVFGPQRPAVEAQLSQKNGLSPAATGTVMAVTAPLVMGMLGYRKRAEKWDAAGVAGFLQGLVGRGPAEKADSGSGGGLMGKLGGLGGKVGGLVDKAKGALDQDKDGDFMDDIGPMVSKLFGKK